MRGVNRLVYLFITKDTISTNRRLSTSKVIARSLRIIYICRVSRKSYSHRNFFVFYANLIAIWRIKSKCLWDIPYIYLSCFLLLKLRVVAGGANTNSSIRIPQVALRNKIYRVHVIPIFWMGILSNRLRRWIKDSRFGPSSDRRRFRLENNFSPRLKLLR